MPQGLEINVTVKFSSAFAAKNFSLPSESWTKLRSWVIFLQFFWTSGALAPILWSQGIFVISKPHSFFVNSHNKHLQRDLANLLLMCKHSGLLQNKNTPWENTKQGGPRNLQIQVDFANRKFEKLPFVNCRSHWNQRTSFHLWFQDCFVCYSFVSFFCFTLHLKGIDMATHTVVTVTRLWDTSITITKGMNCWNPPIFSLSGKLNCTSCSLSLLYQFR